MNRRRRALENLDEDIRAHIEQEIQDNIDRGMTPEEARWAAMRKFGNIARVKEDARSVWIPVWLDQLSQDLHYGLRMLARNRTFTLVALLTLALGIGANTAIFSIVNSVVLQPLDYPKPEQLMYLTGQLSALGLGQGHSSPPEYMEFRELNRSFSDVGAYMDGEATIFYDGKPRRVSAARVDAPLLRALGVLAAEGRLFAPGETEVQGSPAGRPPDMAILSHELWQSAFGGKPIVGQTVDVDGRPHHVIGIMPPGTDVLDNTTEIWLPLGLDPSNRRNRASHFLRVIGRLRDGVTPEAASAELDALLKNWNERAGVGGHAPGNPNHPLWLEPLLNPILGNVRRPIWILQAAVGFVLLIACTNLAGLLLARAEARHHEFAVRAALGASRGRLLRQLIIEGMLLSIAGGALGLLLARVGMVAFVRVYPTSLPRTSEIAIDPFVLLFAFTVSTATGVLFGVAPNLHTRVKSFVTALKESGGRNVTGAARDWIRRGLVVGEVALALMLVIGAALLLRTVYNLANFNPGFDRSRLIAFSIALPEVHYRPSARAQMYQELLRTLRTVPGVEAASAMSGLPPGTPLLNRTTEIDDDQKERFNVTFYQYVMADYFETMRIPILSGRGFEETDATSPGLVAVVNEYLAKERWPGQNPIGKRLRYCCGDDNPWFTVIGVAGDVKQRNVDRETGTQVYLFVEQQSSLPVPPPVSLAPATMHVVLRTTLPLAALAQTVERVIHEADRTVPIVQLREMDATFAESISRPRLLADLVGGFAALALLLSAIGTYGVLSYIVVRRRREIGIRLALGADRTGVLAQVMKQGLGLTVAGVMAGLAGALALNRVMASLLFGIKPTDATTLAIAIVTITLVAVVACWLPAFRASRLDPNVILREE
jgi:putative ABC transport system permease protein